MGGGNLVTAEERAAARWQGAPKPCPAVKMGGDKGLTVSRRCNRDDNHPGRHYDPKHSWWGSSVRDKGTDTPRMQFCDFDWQDRFDANPNAASFYTSFDASAQVLFTVGPCGTMHIPIRNIPAAVAKLRQWADMIEEHSP